MGWKPSGTEACFPLFAHGMASPAAPASLAVAVLPDDTVPVLPDGYDHRAAHDRLPLLLSPEWNDERTTQAFPFVVRTHRMCHCRALLEPAVVAGARTAGDGHCCRARRERVKSAGVCYCTTR